MDSKMAEAERRIEEALRTGAEWLDLGDLALDEIPARIGELRQLRGLALGREGLEKTGELTWCGDRETPRFTDLAPLNTLTGLQILSLDRCSDVVDFSPISALSSLQRLNAWGTDVTDLTPLGALSNLQILDFGFCARVTDLTPLGALSSLQDLNFRDTGVTDLTPLRSLHRLESLDFSATGVANLTPLACLHSLQRLVFAFCQSVADLTPLSPHSSLKILDFSLCTGIMDPTPIWSFPRLMRLDLSGCEFAMPEPLLRHLAAIPELEHLSCDRGDKVPQEVLSQNYFDNCLPRLRAYLAEIDQAAEAENEVKVILLGNGRVGKTQLCRRFRGLEPDDSPSTHGVQLWRNEMRIHAGGKETAFQVNWWDFGGQDIYHGTHALFLRSRAVFLILWTPALENREEDEENGIPLRNQPLAYWLDYVHSLAGSDSPVIVVQSQCDTFGEELPPPPRPEGIEFFRASAYSTWTELGREILEGQVLDAIRYLRQKTGAIEIGSGRAEARRRLYAMRNADQTLPPEERQHRTLSLDEFRSLCDEVGGIASPEHALDYFHQTGVVFYHPGLFSERILLDQTWALDAIYSVFDRRQTAPFLRDSGRFTRENLAYLAWGQYSESEQELFIELMKSCGICFEHGTKFTGETEYVAPDLLPPFEAMERYLRSWQADRPTSTLRLDYQFFHQAIIRGLMSRVGRMAGQDAEYWKYGLWLYDGKREAQVLIQQIDTSAADAPGAGALEIQAQGRDALGLLREIRRSILTNRIGEEPEETLKIDGAVVAKGDRAHSIGGRVRARDGMDIPAEPFAAIFEGHEAERAESQALDPRERLDLEPAPAPDPARRPEVFISYAWGDDDTPEGLHREEVVDRLQKALEKASFDVQRDRDSQRPGDLISAFIKRLGAGDRVVAVISEKYLHSDACMEEIFRIYQSCQADPNRFAEIVVPIILPEVKLGKPELRAKYVRDWIQRADELDKLFKELGIKAGQDAFFKACLAADLASHAANILSFVDDILMPRNLEGLFDSHFEAVIEALLRRLKKAVAR